MTPPNQKPYAEARDEAGIETCASCGLTKGTDQSIAVLTGFEIGADWSRSFTLEDPVILRMAEALRLANKLECKGNCEGYLKSGNEHGPFCQTITEALDDFERLKAEAGEVNEKDESKVDPMKFHRRVDELVCNWSLMTGHAFSEQELNSLVDLLGDDFKAQAVKIHAHGVRAGKILAEAGK